MRSISLAALALVLAPFIDELSRCATLEMWERHLSVLEALEAALKVEGFAHEPNLFRLR